MSDISLFDIEMALHRLLDVWQEAQGQEEIEAAEVAIKEYAQLEVRRVDGIRKYLRFCDTMADAAKADMQAQAQRCRMWEARRDRLKAFVFDTMQSFNTKKLEGQTGNLRIQANGGKQAVTITNESLVPDEFCVYEGRIPVPLCSPEMRRVLEVFMKRLPVPSVISKALEAKCEDCNGDDQGVLMGEHACKSCGGTGKASVAGCRLEARGSSLRVD